MENLAHELRTPVNAVIAPCALLCGVCGSVRSARITVRSHGSRAANWPANAPSVCGRLVAHNTLMLPVFTPESPVLDVSVMAAIRSLGTPDEPDVYAQVVSLFLVDVPIHLSALGEAIAAADSEAVWRIAHRLRGSTLEMGVVRMAPLCAELEDAARAGSLEHAAAQADSLGREFAAARAAMEQAIE